MASTTNNFTPTARIDRAAEHRFYSRMAIAVAVVVFIGFAPSFYLYRSFSWPRPNPDLTPLMILHGVLQTAWLGLFIVQTQLIAAGKPARHRQMGVGGFALACLLVPTIYFTAVHGIAHPPPPYIDALSWSAISLLDLPLLVLLLALGWRYRHQPQTHKRLMLLVLLRMVEPGIGRIPLAPPSELTQWFVSFLAWLWIVPLMRFDRAQLGRLHWVTIFGAVAIAANMLTRYFVWHSPLWHQIASTLPG